jgi:hypothetical protein
LSDLGGECRLLPAVQTWNYEPHNPKEQPGRGQRQDADSNREDRKQISDGATNANAASEKKDRQYLGGYEGDDSECDESFGKSSRNGTQPGSFLIGDSPKNLKQRGYDDHYNRNPSKQNAHAKTATADFQDSRGIIRHSSPADRIAND